MHAGRGVIDGNGPVVAGHIPIKFVVTIEEARAVAYAVGDLYGASGIDGVGNVDLEVAVGAGGRRVILELGAVFVGDAGDVEEELVVGAVCSRIFDGDGAVNAVPLAYEV